MLRRSLLLAALALRAQALVLPASGALGLPATGLVLPSAGLDAVGDVFSGNTDESAAAPANAAVPADRQQYFAAAELGNAGAGGSGAKRKGPSKKVGYLTLQAGLADPLAVWCVTRSLTSCSPHALPLPPPALTPPPASNDGSPANYYYRRGSDSTNWLVYLEVRELRRPSAQPGGQLTFSAPLGRHVVLQRVHLFHAQPEHALGDEQQQAGAQPGDGRHLQHQPQEPVGRSQRGLRALLLIGCLSVPPSKRGVR